MELSEIKQLTHKIVKINLKNENFYSIFDYITQKITLTNVRDDEVIRFSLEENSNFIQHQSFNNDYYIIIPNNLNSITEIYVHYFPSDLYEYEEDENISFNFDFTQLLQAEDGCTYITAADGHQYPVVKTGTGYTMEAGDKKGSLIVRSLLDKSIDGYKNPNYKDVTATNINDKKDMTEQGYFPLSSRYRPSYKYFNEAPDLIDNPHWTASSTQESVCKASPYWQVRINRDGLSRLIADREDGEYASIAVNLNYQYLPTSSRQHQHYYGFEDECPQTNDIYVLEGTHLDEVNENFNSDTYRIIERHNPYDNSNTMHVDHECILPLELLTCTPKDYITKNKCYDYYIYTAIGNEIPSIVKNLTEGEQYSLRYFIFVPSKVDTLVEEDNNNRPKTEVRNTNLLPFTSDMNIYGGRTTTIENGIFHNTEWDYGGFINYSIPNTDKWTFEFDSTMYRSGWWSQYQAIYFKDANSNNYNSGFRINDNGEIYGFNGTEDVLLGNINLKTTTNLSFNHKFVITKTSNTHLHMKVYTQKPNEPYDDGTEIDFEFPYLPNIEAFHLGIRNYGSWCGWIDVSIAISNFQITTYSYEYLTDIISPDCYLSVNGERIPDEFLVYDRSNRDRWVYHEVPFVSQGEDLIEVVGPKNNSDIQFFLIGVEIEKFIPYSPTLTYNKSGLSVNENLNWDELCKGENKYTSGQTKRIPDTTAGAWEIRNATNIWEKHNKLPSPKGKVFFTLNDDVEFDYDENSTNFFFSHLDTCEYKIKYYPHDVTDEYNIHHNEADLYQKNYEDIYLRYFPNDIVNIDTTTIPIIELTPEIGQSDDVIVLYRPPQFKIPEENKNDDIIIRIQKQNGKMDYEHFPLIVNNDRTIELPDEYIEIGTYHVRVENQETDSGFAFTYMIDDADNARFREGDIVGTYPRNVMFYKGPNNSFYLYVNDEFGLPVTRGTVEVEFIKYRTLESPQLVYAGKRIIQKDGTAYFNKIDLSDIEVINGKPTKYYLRITYNDPCFDDGPIYDFKIVYVEYPNLKMVPKINGNFKNKRFISYDNNGNPIYAQDCSEYRQSRHFEDDFNNNITKTYAELENPSSILNNNGERVYQAKWNHYDILDKTPFKGLPNKFRGGYYVYDVEAEFPLQISAYIYNETSTGRIGELGIGYCELSVDDKVAQTTLVDEDGLADFYLDLSDVPLNKHVIKIEYYNKYWEPIKYFYFDLVICDVPTKVRPSVPIIFKKFPYCPGYVKTEDDTKCKFFYLNDSDLQLYIPQDDTLILDMENKEHTNYQLSLYRHKEGYKNINRFTDINSILIDSIKIYDDPELPLFFATGLEFDTMCKINRNGKEKLHPTNPIQAESDQIENLEKLIIKHGVHVDWNIRNSLHSSIQQINSQLTICPETLCDTLLYAPILYAKRDSSDHKLEAYLYDYYILNNTMENIVYYSLVTDNLSGQDTYRPFRRTFGVHYMNYIEATNYEIKAINNGPIYSLNNEGYWEFNKIQIVKNSDNGNVDNDDIIREGIIEIYFNGEQYQFVDFYDYGNTNVLIEQIKIPKKTNNDKIQLRYIFEDGYHFVTK